MLDYNKEKLQTQNDIETDAIRTRKRKIKEEVKQLKGKLGYQLRHPNPNSLLEDVNFLYKEGVTTRQLELQKERGGKYHNAPHIGRVIP